jgi:hypothetical protein
MRAAIAALERPWIDGLAHGQPAPPASAQPAPHQAQPSRPLAPLAWYESPWLQLAALLLFGVAFAGYPLTAAARRIRGRRGAPPVRRPARWLAATVATAVAWLRHRCDLTGASHVRLGVLLAAGLVFSLWAAYWGLLIP